MNVVSAALSFFISYVYNPDMDFVRKKLALNGQAMLFTIGALVLLTLFLLGIFWCIYRLLYGTLLRRLYSNYKELKKIDF